jgi:hypothetical protein
MIRFCFYTLLIGLSIGCGRDVRWKGKLEVLLNEFGHRNWIVVADYAYPCQSSAGIETLFTGQDHFEVLDFVLERIQSAPHIRPRIRIDRELDFLSDADATGIEEYRSELKRKLVGLEVSSLPHEEIIHALDACSELYKVLIMKTGMALPYTSVFIELDCGYWDAEKESRLRRAMANPLH